MIKKNWKLLVLAALCLVALAGYRMYDGWRTDTVAPKITVSDSGVPEMSVYAPEALLEGVTAIDDRDGDVTASIVVENVNDIKKDGTVTVTYAAFDSSGNVAKTQRTVRYTDYKPPRFTLRESLDFVYNTGFDVLDVVGAVDLLDGDIGYRVKATATDAASINTEGVHNVRFWVSNSLGDTSELVLPVEVYYSGRYNAQLKLTDYLLYLDRGEAFDPMDYLREYIAGGEDTSLTNGIPAGLTLETEGRVDTDNPGVYVISYTVSSTRGSTLFEGYARLIVVVEA